mmetsp:Transcript_73005/g.163913  ORF Transcript_73005/g.163913 Transcript_73005/m.163913 type:complete len:136 (+) Transcript_73005:2-409(+)
MKKLDRDVGIAPGDHVVVSGLTSEGGRQLNGRRGIVVMRKGDRFEVRFGSGQVSALKPCNLKKLALKPGDLVEVHGLASDSGDKLNGWKGTIERYVEDTGRFEVRFPPRRVVSLRPENLVQVDADYSEDYPGRWD